MAAPNILCNTKGMDRKTWLACRAHGPDGSIPIALGGSDIAAVFGLNPWKTPLDLWMEKAGMLMPDESENQWQKEMGHLLEPVVARMYAFRTGNTVIEDHNLYQHAAYPWALANVDYRMREKNTNAHGGLECKSTTYFNAKEWKDDQIPMYYEYQCRHYMGVLDLPFWDISCMWGNGEDDMPIRRIYRDAAIEDMIFSTGEAFIKSIIDGKPPTMADVMPELAMKSLARIYGAAANASATIEFGRKHERQIARIAALQEENRELERSIRKNDKEVTALSVQIAEAMKEHEHGVLETPFKRFDIEYTSSGIRRVNGAKLRDKYPEIYEEMLNPPGQRRIKIAAVAK